jgi:hypothetical protein
MIARIHVHQQTIKRNMKEGRQDPPIRIQTSRGKHDATDVQINGPSRLVYSPDKPLNCGARLWIETKFEDLEWS